MAFVAVAVRKGDRLRMEEQSRQAQRAQTPVRGFVTIAFVPGEREPDRLCVNPDLVCPARVWRALQQAVFAVRARQAHAGPRRFALRMDYYVALSALAMGNEQSFVDEAFSQLPITDGQCQIVFFNEPLAKAFMERAQRAAAFRQHQAA